MPLKCVRSTEIKSRLLVFGVGVYFHFSSSTPSTQHHRVPQKHNVPTISPPPDMSPKEEPKDAAYAMAKTRHVTAKQGRLPDDDERVRHVVEFGNRPVGPSRHSIFSGPDRVKSRHFAKVSPKGSKQRNKRFPADNHKQERPGNDARGSVARGGEKTAQQGSVTEGSTKKVSIQNAKPMKDPFDVFADDSNSQNMDSWLRLDAPIGHEALEERGVGEDIKSDMQMVGHISGRLQLSTSFGL